MSNYDNSQDSGNGDITLEHVLNSIETVIGQLEEHPKTQDAAQIITILKGFRETVDIVCRRRPPRLYLAGGPTE